MQQVYTIPSGRNALSESSFLRVYFDAFSSKNRYGTTFTSDYDQVLFLQKIDMERPLQATMIKVASSFSSAVLPRAKNATRRRDMVILVRGIWTTS